MGAQTTPEARKPMPHCDQCGRLHEDGTCHDYPCSAEGCEAVAEHVTSNDERVCTACAKDGDYLFWTKCDHCGDDVEVRFADLNEACFCNDECLSKAASEENDMQYAARYGR